MELPVILALVVIGLFGFMGYRDGLVKRVLETVGLIAVIILPARFSGQVTPWVMDKTGTEEGMAQILAWIGMAVGGLLLSRLVALLVSKFVQMTILGWVDRLGGAVLGITIGALLSSFALVVANKIPGGESVEPQCKSSTLGSLIYNVVPNLYVSAQDKYGVEAGEIFSDAVKDAKKKVAEKSGEISKDAMEKAEELGDKAKEQVEETVKDVVEDKVGL